MNELGDSDSKHSGVEIAPVVAENEAPRTSVGDTLAPKASVTDSAIPKTSVVENASGIIIDHENDEKYLC